MKIRLALVGSILALIILTALPSAMGAIQAPYALTGVIAVDPLGTPTAKAFTIIVSAAGFNGSAAPLTLQVNRGDNLTIKFVYGDGDLNFDNPHIIRIEGYGITTGRIDKETPVQTVTFTAGQVGRFQFHCVIPCFGMENLQNGALEVTPIPTKIAVSTETTIRHMETHPSLHLHVIAVVTDTSNNPIAGVVVDFLVETSFGLMKVGSNVSQADGSAHFLYPLTTSREMRVVVNFGGSGNFKASNATGTLVPNYTSVQTNETTPYLSQQSPSVDLRLVGVPPLTSYIIVLVALTVIAAVWSVYVFVLTQILAIRKVAQKEAKN